MGDDARQPVVEVRPEEVARLLRDCLIAPASELDKPSPAIARIVALLSSPDSKNWGTALQVCSELSIDASLSKEQRVVIAQHLQRGVRITLISR